MTPSINSDPGSAEVVALYQALLESWNARRADDYAAQFADEGHLVGFDGTLMDGRAAIAEHLHQIFDHHQTATYVWKLVGVDRLGADVAMLRAVAGMLPPGGSDLNPDTNAIQSLIAYKRDGRWRISLFQNTPAAFHGRPEAKEQLTAELRQLLHRAAKSR